MKIDVLDEGDFFVSGTTDLNDAIALIEQDDMIRDEAPEDEDWEIELLNPQIGLWRKVPCSPNACGEHGWHVVKANQRGRGVMFGILTGAVIRTLEFESDEPDVDRDLTRAV